MNRLKLNLLKLLLSREDIAQITISLGITEEVYFERFNNPNHIGYKSESLRYSLDKVKRIQSWFDYMLGIPEGYGHSSMMERSVDK